MTRPPCAHPLAAAMLAALALAVASPLPAQEPTPHPVALDGLRGQNARILANTDAHARILFEPAEWSNAVLDFNPPADWSAFGRLVLTLDNPGDQPLELGVRLDDDPSADGRKHCIQGTIPVPSRSKITAAIGIGPDPMSLGMRGLPGPAGLRTVTAGGDPKFNPGHIVSVRFFLHRPAKPTPFGIAAVSLSPAISQEAFVDRFGQYAFADWPGKLHEEQELAQRRDAETAELSAHPSLPGRDRFGGWADGPKLDATGFFRTEKHNGKWWLVDPDGRLFFSSGVDCVDQNGATILTGREPFFSWLPEEGDPLAAFYGHVNNVIRGPVKEGRTFDFHRANLYRKFGPDWKTSWREYALKRLPSWGFNTIGNWSNWDLYGNGKVPYVATTGVYGEHARVASGSDYWGEMHDPFDPKFAENAERAIAGVAHRIGDDPWCVGIFVDNELSWGSFGGKDVKGRLGLAIGALNAGADSPAHQEILRQLHAKYAKISDLNASWGTSFASWDALETQGARDLPESFNEALQQDLAAFVSSLAMRYFTTIRDAIRKHDPNHLYLGCRFAWQTPEAVAAAAKVCDVVSFNIYRPKVDPKEWPMLNDLGKPAIIGEYHVGATDRGMFHTGLVAATDQNARAATFAEYLQSVIDHPTLVGCHWFQYTDQAITGRTYDGENYNIGFVTVTDTPYPEMVRAAREVHRTLYPRRESASPSR